MTWQVLDNCIKSTSHSFIYFYLGSENLKKQSIKINFEDCILKINQIYNLSNFTSKYFICLIYMQDLTIHK